MINKPAQIRPSAILIFTLVIGLSVLAGAGFAQTPAERLTRASAAVNKGDLDAAMTDISEIIRVQPDMARAYYLRGIVNYNRNDYDQAIADQTRAIELDPKPAEYYYNRAIASEYKAKPDYSSAMADLNHALQIAPAYGAALNERGWINVTAQKWAEAANDYSAAIQNGVSSKRIYLNRGVANFNLKNYTQAAADYRKALEIDPNYAAAKSNLDHVLSVMQQTAGSGTDGLSSAELLRLAGEAKKSGDLVAQEKYLNASIVADPRNFDAVEQRVFLYDGSGRHDLAIADCARLIAIDPANLDGYYLRASIYRGLKDYAGAIPDYTAQLGLKLTTEQTASIYYLRGEAYRKIYDYPRAEADFNKTLELQPNLKGALTDRAEIYEFQGNYDQAEADLKKLQQIDPGNKFAESELGNIKMFRKTGFNTGKVKENTLFVLSESVDKLTVDSEIYTKNLGLITTVSNETPNNSAKICGAVTVTDVALKKVEADAATLGQMITTGKLDKLPTFKTAIEGLLGQYPEDRKMVDGDAAKYGCKLN